VQVERVAGLAYPRGTQIGGFGSVTQRSTGNSVSMSKGMQLTIRLLREMDDRWIGDVPELPGVSVYGATAQEAEVKAKALALRVIAEEIARRD
jgi:predicted RNase H-like HicB family nuclease